MEGACVSMTTLPISWETECSVPSNTGSSLIVQGTGGPVNDTLHRSTGGAYLLAESPVSVEWENSDSETGSVSDTVRCLTARLGGSLQQREHWRLMEPPRAAFPHKRLELLAAELTLKTFVKSLCGISVLVQLDNSTAVAYTNNLGGTVSPALTALAKSMCLWALERDVMIRPNTYLVCPT